MITNNAYTQLVKLRQQLADIGSAAAVLSWDQEVLMPEGASARRARQLATLAELQHQMTVEQLPTALAAAREQSGLTHEQQLNLAQLARDLERQQKLPGSFVAELTETTSRAQRVWEGARSRNAFAEFEPWLTKIVELKRREADYYGYADHPYDALLDSYEPGVKTAAVTARFAQLRPRLQTLLNQVRRRPQVDDSFLHQPLSQTDQLAFAADILRAMGYSFQHGRQDLSAHPFCTSFGPEDVRITTRYKERDFTFLVYSSIHEGGHALYEQGLNPEQYGMPWGEACSLSIHESQSRLWENNVARSLGFWQHWFPRLQQLMPDGLRGKGPEEVFRAVNRVEPSLIRIEADELTYHFHIIIRFELEQALVKGDLQVKDLPAVWNERYRDYLGVQVPGDAQGVLQDVHWSLGAIGYFATYSLGSLYSAQLLAQAELDLGSLETKWAAGEFAPLRSWLQGKIFDHGRLYTSEELCKLATGRELSIEPFVEYLTRKLTRVYGL